MSFNALCYHIDDFKTITTTNIALTTFDCPNYLRIFVSSFVVLVYLKLQILARKQTLNTQLFWSIRVKNMVQVRIIKRKVNKNTNKTLIRIKTFLNTYKTAKIEENTLQYTLNLI